MLTQGIAKQTGLGFGLITVLTSGVVLLLWIPLRQRLGFGTVMNALLVGPAADVGLWLIPSGLDLWVRIGLLAAGILVLAAATGLYIGAHFGPGPRDGLMTGLHRVTGWRIWIVRTGIELIVLGAGWLLGGNVGIGTVAFALLIGPHLRVHDPPVRDQAHRARQPSGCPRSGAPRRAHAPRDPGRRVALARCIRSRFAPTTQRRVGDVGAFLVN